MSLATLRDRIRTARSDDRITLAEVEAFIRSASADGSVNFQEALLLQGELDAHGHLFEPEARKTLEAFLQANQPRR